MAFLLGVVVVAAVIGIMAGIYLPKAIIEVSPATIERSVEQKIILSAAAGEPDFVKFVLPSRVVTKEVTEQQVITRGQGETREDFAKGAVKMINKQAEEQRLLPKTNLRHGKTGVFFLTDKAVIIPPQAEIEVGITAKEAGAKGNVEAGRFVIDKLPASLQSTVYAESGQATTGGLVVDQPLTEAEKKLAEDKVLAAARERLMGEMTSAAGGALLRQDLTAFNQKELTVSADVGSQTSKLLVRAVVEAKSFIVDENDLLSLTLLNLRGAAGPDEEFVTYDPQTFSAKLIRSDFERGEAVITGSLSGTFAAKLGSALFSADNIAGLTAEEAREQLRKLPGVGEVKVLFSPFWVTSIPSRPEAVEILVISK